MLMQLTLTSSLPPQTVCSMPILNELHKFLHELLVFLGRQVLAHLYGLSTGIFALRPELNCYALLASSLARHCVPCVAAPASSRPLDLIDRIWLGSPLLHVCVGLHPAQELLLAVWLEVCWLSWRRRFRYRCLAHDSDSAFSPWCEQLILQLLYARLAG
jgi:hypothetical protein